MIRVGIVGFGFMGQTHWRCYGQLADRAKVVAVADLDLRRARGDISGTWGNLGDGAQSVDFSGVKGTTDWRELVAMSDVDVVDVCVPTPSHPEIAIEALAAGKHVLCEKPLARTVKAAESIAIAAKAARGFMMPAMCIRFWPQWAWLKQAIDDRRFGRVLGATFLRQGSGPPGWYRNGEMSGGALLDLHIHDTDFVCHLFGMPQAVSSRGYRAHSGAYDHVSTQYIYNDVPLVTADGGWSFAAPYPFRMRYTVAFENGVTADYDLARAEPLMVYTGEKGEAIECAATDGWFEEIRYFIDRVAEGQRPTVVTADDAVRAVSVIEAEARSIAGNRIEAVG
ncbi:MAG: Gfo/Idh/MocA family protein [Pirellulales bacterium]